MLSFVYNFPPTFICVFYALGYLSKIPNFMWHENKVEKYPREKLNIFVQVTSFAYPN